MKKLLAIFLVLGVMLTAGVTMAADKGASSRPQQNNAAQQTRQNYVQPKLHNNNPTGDRQVGAGETGHRLDYRHRHGLDRPSAVASVTSVKG